MKKCIILVILCSLFVGCRREPLIGGGDPEIEFHRSYVMYYYDMEQINLTIHKESIIINDPPFEGVDGVLAPKYLSLGNYKSTGEKKKSYDALCEKHVDMEFNRDFVVWDSAGPYITMALGIDFISVDIVSDADFDAAHPAGTSLGDLVAYEAYSHAPYIESGYTLDIPRSNLGFLMYIKGLLSEITPEKKLYLLEARYSSLGSLHFTSKPTKSKTHTFTVTMTPDDARPPFTASITMTFD